MQTLAQGVGDLKKVLTNVKTRGIVGEIQLGAILEDILAPEQYEVNVATRPGSRNVVEYAVKLPVEDGSHVWLPIDSKFPGDTMARCATLMRPATARRSTRAPSSWSPPSRPRQRTSTISISSRPIPRISAFCFCRSRVCMPRWSTVGWSRFCSASIMSTSQGPSTMAALLNSLQMSFRTIAIQKRSGEVWSVLGAVKTEFDKFEACLTQTQNRLDQASREAGQAGRHAHACDPPPAQGRYRAERGGKPGGAGFDPNAPDAEGEE